MTACEKCWDEARRRYSTGEGGSVTAIYNGLIDEHWCHTEPAPKQREEGLSTQDERQAIEDALEPLLDDEHTDEEVDAAVDAILSVTAPRTHSPEELVGYVDQPDDERCFTACLASLTGLPLDGFPMPPKERYHTTEVSWHNRLTEHLRANGWRLTKTWRDVPRGHAIATGPSPRREGFYHCVITLDGQIVHDPHPSRDGVDEVHEYEIVVPIRPIGQPLAHDPETEE